MRSDRTGKPIHRGHRGGGQSVVPRRAAVRAPRVARRVVLTAKTSPTAAPARTRPLPRRPAEQQRITLPAEQVAAAIAKDLAGEALDVRAKIDALDAQIAELLDAHPDAALIRSLPAMGATLTAELLAVAGGLNRFAAGDQLASAAGLAPALQQSGKVRYLQRATNGDRTLKMIFYQSAFCALQRDPASRAYYDRKRCEGKSQHQAVIALARRRINVLHAILRSRQPYRQPAEQAAA